MRGRLDKLIEPAAAAIDIGRDAANVANLAAHQTDFVGKIVHWHGPPGALWRQR